MNKQKTGNYFFNVLNKSQANLMPKLKYLKARGFYLAGGTGLALQLGHRTSADLDFYSKQPFEIEKIINQIKHLVKKVKSIQIQEGTLILTCENIVTSVFYYPYPLLKPFLKLKDVLIASLEDIAAMKLVAIIQGGTCRDFIDIYYLIKMLGLDYILSQTEKKYKEFNIYLTLQALLYFDDAEKETLGLRQIELTDRISWPNIKSYIISEVKKIYAKK